MGSFINTNKWPKTDTSRQYLLFATRLRELVHPKAQDIYRVHALSTIAKVEELYVTAARVRDREIPKPTILPIISEVNEALSNDPIVSGLCSKKGIEPEDLDFKETQTTEEIISRCLLWLEFLKDNYREEIEEEIVTVIKDIKEKARLLLLAKLYVSHLVFEGFHRSYIEQSTKDVFFIRDVGRCTEQMLRRFFSYFSGSQKNYVVAFEAPNPLAEILKAKFRISLSSDVEKLGETLGYELDIPDVQQEHTYALFPQIEATDPFRAVSKLNTILQLPRSFEVVYPSGVSTGKVKDKCWVFNPKEKTSSCVSQKDVFQPVHSFTSLLPDNSELFPSFVDYAWAGVERDDFAIVSRLGKSLNAAAGALEVTEPQVQLVSLWSAFEALLPEPTRDGSGVRIQHFVDLIAPCVVQKYIRGKFRIFIDDIPQHMNLTAPEIFGEEIARTERPRRLAEILQKDTDELKELFQKFSGNPLLCNRLFYLGKLSRDPSLALKKLNNHENRVRWQLHRIYRQRNLIVHSGSAYSYLPTLVENAFLYYRLVMRGLQSIHKDDEIYHTDNALQLLSVRYEKRKTRLAAMVIPPKIRGV